MSREVSLNERAAVAIASSVRGRVGRRQRSQALASCKWRREGQEHEYERRVHEPGDAVAGKSVRYGFRRVVVIIIDVLYQGEAQPYRDTTVPVSAHQSLDCQTQAIYSLNITNKSLSGLIALARLRDQVWATVIHIYWVMTCCRTFSNTL